MNVNIYNKVFMSMALPLVILQAVFLGVDIQAGNGKEILLDGIFLVFWTFTLVFFHLMITRDLKHELSYERMRRQADNKIEKLMEDLKKEIDEKSSHRQIFTDIFFDVVGKDFHDAKTVNAKQKAQIEKRFNEKTGFYALVTNKAKGGIGVELSNNPLVAKKKAPAKKNVTTKKGKK